MTIDSAKEFIRLRMSSDEVEYSRAATDSAPTSVWKDIVEHHRKMRFWVAQNKTVPVEVLAELASASDVRVRVMVAMKRNLDQSLFERLAVDEDEGVRAAVARNAKTPGDIRRRLLGDSSEVVRGAAAAHQ